MTGTGRPWDSRRGMIASLVAGVLSLVPLHRADGGTIWVNPAEVLTLTEPRRESDPRKTAAHGTHCLVFLGSRHSFAVQESCETVKTLLEDRGK